jgi:hypothetical protein
VGQALLGSIQLCGLTAAFGTGCCAAPEAAADAAAQRDSALQTEAAPEAAQGMDEDCSCPFDCALGCCCPARALAPRVVALESARGESEQLDPVAVHESPPSPDARGILHVPIRAV